MAAVVGFVTVAAVDEPAGGQPSGPVTPPGMTVLLDSGAWSWFEDERAIVDFAGDRLYVSAVADAPTPGEVVAAEIDIATGDRKLVGLGAAELDDHNSAAIWEAPSGEVLTAWARHSADPQLRTHRRRSDSSWLRLPLVTDDTNVTYNNLYSVLAEDGTAVLYDFYRGTGFDPEAMVSIDAGRTWSQLGRVLRDPADAPGGRPYVRYASRDDRIDLIATEEHPAEAGRTSVYHGFIRNGILHTSTGTALGQVGTAINVTRLTRIWQATPSEEAWTVDLGYDPATGHPVAAISTTLTVDDHRYYIGRWNGTTWHTQQIAHSGRALYPGQPHYTGLVALDPRDTNHVVISTDADPVTGAPLVSTTDGRRHWELFDGHRQPDGSYRWTPLTANSTVDNLRPIITMNETGAWALAWLRGRYTSYTNYQLQVAGVVQRPDGSHVATSPTTTRRPVVAGKTDTGPDPTAAVPLAGQFDTHPAADTVLYRAGTGREDLVIGDDGRHPVHAYVGASNGSFRPFTGDFDADGDDDIFWYAPGTATDYVWLSRPDGTFTTRTAPVVSGTSYRPAAGDFDADGDDDILWYAPGTETDYVWTTGPNLTWEGRATSHINGDYVPVPGDFDADSDDDIIWYASGTATDYLWTTQPGTTWTTTTTPAINSPFTPVPGDFDADGDTDVLWYGTGTDVDRLWTTGPGPTWGNTTRTVNGVYRPAAADHDGDGTDDILWYATGIADDYAWYSANGILDLSQRLPLNI